MTTNNGISQREARRLLGQVRQGVPPDPDMVPYIRVGREDEENKIVSDPVDGLESVSYGNGHVFFVLGDFGFGKSFFLNLIAERSGERDFLWSMPEIPDIGTLSNKTEFCTEIISEIRYPDQQGTGSAPLLRKFCNEMTLDEFEQMAIEHNLVGGPCYQIFKQVMKASIHNKVEVSHSKREGYVDFADVLAGAASYMHNSEVSLDQLHAIGKNGFSSISNEDEYEYLKGIRSLAIELDYSGVVTLIDEFAEEEMDWNPDEDTEKRLIDLVNKCYQKDEFTNMMFVFVGNRVRWDDLIDSASGGHEALRHRYNAGKLELESLSKNDYTDLVQRMAQLVSTAYNKDISLTASDCRNIVENAVSKHGSVDDISPRKLILQPTDTDADLIDMLREAKY